MGIGVQVVIDCADPGKLAKFWAFALNYQEQNPPAGYASWPDFLLAQGYPRELWNAASAIVDPEGKGPRVYFQKVPEPKVVKNRLHLDLNVGGGMETPLEERKSKVNEQVERLIKAGASKIEPREQHGEFWVVMADPEGNEFCLHWDKILSDSCLV